MYLSFPIMLLACLVISATSRPLKVCKIRHKPGKNAGQVKPLPKVDQPSISARIYEVNKGLEQGIQQIIYGDIVKGVGRFATNCISCRWPQSEDGTVQVPYNLSSSYSADDLNLFLISMQEYESMTCVRFVPRTTEISYLNIVPTGGCTSHVGRIGGAQTIELSVYGCLFRGIIQHELNHALGFYHEHTRDDRDQYVIINFGNIRPDSVDNFVKVEGNELGLPYDYSSVMHYDKYANAINNSIPTIIPTPDPNVPIGNAEGLSALDVEKINTLYNCNVCSMLLDTLSGNFTSANYPSNYPNNMKCVWLIRTPSGQVSLTFNDFRIQDSSDCTSDFIRIYDGASRSSPMILDRTCGSITLPTIVSSSSLMLIEFVSDSQTTSAGFSASYNTVPCGGTFFSATGSWTSPGYSTGSYPPYLTCNYNIYAPPGYKISITVTYDIEAGFSCMYDRLTVYQNGALGLPRYQICGTGTVTLKSVNNRMLLVFVSDQSIQTRGFSLTYTTDKQSDIVKKL